MPDNQFADALKSARKATKLSQRDAAAELKKRGVVVSERALAGYEREENEPDEIKQAQILQVLRNIAGQSSTGQPNGQATSSPSRTMGIAALVERFGVNVPDPDDAFVLTIYHSIRPAAGNPNRFIVEGDEEDADRQLQSKRIFHDLLGFWPPDDMCGAYLEGWSMKREVGGLSDGQLVLYRPVKAIDSGRRYLLTIVDLDTGDISPLCKRLQQFAGGGLKIISDNPAAGVEDEVLLPNGNGELVNERTGRHVHVRVAGVVLWPRDDDDERHVRTITRTIEQLAARGLLPPGS